LVGCCGLRPWDTESGTYEFGVHILPEFWYKGLAIEAALAVIEYAKKRKFTKIFAVHHPNNDASKKVLAKLGFVPFSLEFYSPTGLEHPFYVLELS
jgi:RimJ/RimL family protein N-acetyltransferase